MAIIAPPPTDPVISNQLSQIMSNISEIKRSMSFNKRDWTDRSLERQARLLEAVSLVAEQQPTGLISFILSLIRSLSKTDDGTDETTVETSLEKEIRENLAKDLAEQILVTIRVKKEKEKKKRKSDDACTHCKSSNHDIQNCWLLHPDKAPASWVDKRMRRSYTPSISYSPPLYPNQPYPPPQQYPQQQYQQQYPQQQYQSSQRPRGPPLSCGFCGKGGHTEHTCFLKKG